MAAASGNLTKQDYELRRAIQIGDIDEVQTHIDNGINLGTTIGGISTLDVAVSKNNRDNMNGEPDDQSLEIIRLLLQNHIYTLEQLDKAEQNSRNEEVKALLLKAKNVTRRMPLIAFRKNVRDKDIKIQRARMLAEEENEGWNAFQRMISGGKRRQRKSRGKSRGSKSRSKSRRSKSRRQRKSRRKSRRSKSRSKSRRR